MDAKLIDMADGVRRFAGDLDGYTETLQLFLTKNNLAEIRRCIETGDEANLKEYTHALKGMAGGLGLLRLFEVVSDVYARLRDGSMTDAAAEFAPVFVVLDETMQTIKEILA
ncbi:MAG: hypothetical protein PHS97_00690 [Oscillospiraceae bacterium]|nr:hypothetical protein [Oscillospiraceae bacterium]